MSVAELPDLAGSPDLPGPVAPGDAQVVRLVPPSPPQPVEDDAAGTVSPLARFVGGPFPNLRSTSRTSAGPYANLAPARR